MELFVELGEKKLIQSLSNSRTVSAPTFTQGDSEPLILLIIEQGDEGNSFAEKIGIRAILDKVYICATLNSDGEKNERTNIFSRKKY